MALEKRARVHGEGGVELVLAQTGRVRVPRRLLRKREMVLRVGASFGAILILLLLVQLLRVAIETELAVTFHLSKQQERVLDVVLLVNVAACKELEQAAAD